MGLGTRRAVREGETAMESQDHTTLLAQLARLERDLVTVRRELQARRPAEPRPVGPLPAILIVVAGERYAIPSANVRLVVHYAKLSKIPKAPPAILGALNFKGQPVVVLDVAERLGLGKTAVDLGTKIVFALVHGRLTGLALDRVLDVTVFEAEDLEPPSSAIASAVCVSHIGTVDDSLVQVLDLEQLLSQGDLDFATILEEAAPEFEVPAGIALGEAP
jgi:purine-binding chemotaxis protein CheW